MISKENFLDLSTVEHLQNLWNTFDLKHNKKAKYYFGISTYRQWNLEMLKEK